MKATLLLLFGIISSIQLLQTVNCQEASPEDAKTQEDEGTDVVEQPMDEKVDEHWVQNRAKTLDLKSFDEKVIDPETSTVREGNSWFIMFFAPWCTHCKRVSPLWDDFHTKYGEQVNIAKVDCTNVNATALCEQYHVDSFPTMLFFHGQKTYEYQQERDIELLYKFTQEGYNSAPERDVKDIPPRLDGFQKYQAEYRVLVQQLQTSVDTFFERFNLNFIPSVARYFLTAFSVISPVAVVAVILVFGEYETEAEKQQKQEAAKEAAKQEKQEKKKEAKQEQKGKKGKEKKQDLKSVKKVDDSSEKKKNQ